MTKKRAQITIFIIIGIIVLFSVGAIFLIQTITQEKELIVEEPELQKLSAELLPVRNYVDACIRDIATDALSALGEHGGYINIKDSDNNVHFNINEGAPTEGDAVPFLPGSDLVIPYWAYMTSPNANIQTCSFSSKRPPLKKDSATQFVPSDAAIETQLERYMDKNLKTCINNFFPLEREGFDIEDGSVSTEVTVTENDVRFTVDYPLKIDLSGSTTDLGRFFVKIPLELSRIYDLATTLANLQTNSSFLEVHALSLISVYSGLQSNDIPPFGESGFDFGGGKTWAKAKVKQDVTSMLTSWIRGLQVFGSANFHFISAPSDSPYADSINRVYNNMVIPLTGYNDLITNFDYLGWPLYFDIPSSEGQLIKPESISNNLFSTIGYQEYRTYYDISFPVYVEIKTLPTLDFPEGYKFLFFLESNIRNTDKFSCGTELIETPVIATNNLICNENQRLSGDVDINVIDAYTEEPIEDALISYNLGDNSCVYSKTDSSGQLMTKTPTAIGGAITAMKSGYLANSEALDVELNESASVTIKLWKKKRINVAVKRLTYPPATTALLPLANTKPIKLDNNEEAMLILTKVKDTPYEGSINPAGQFSNDEPLQFELVPGEYSIEAQVMLDKRAIIPPMKRDEYVSPMVDLPPPHLWGGLKYGQFIVKPQKLYESNELQFVVLSFPDPTVTEHTQWLSQIKSETEKYKRALKPKFKE